MNAAPSIPPPDAEISRWTFERKLTLGYAGSVLVLLLVVALCSWEAVRFVEFNHQVEHDHEVIDVVEAVREQVTVAESNQRGYFLLGDDALRQTAEAAIVGLSARLQHLGELVADNPEQVRRLRGLNNNVREKAARIRFNLGVRERLGLSTLLEQGYATGLGQRLGLQVLASSDEIIRVEQASLRDHLTQRRDSVSAFVYCLLGLGGLIGVLLTALYRLGDGELRARRQLSRDLLVARDEALEAARQKSEFLANMSHEIRTPLNGIVGMSGLLREKPLDAETRDCAGTIETCSEALLSVINDVLDFSKIEAGRLHFDHAAFDLRETVDETLAILSSRASAKRLELNALVASDVPAGLIGDPHRLRQVLLNLLGNAVKFTERGEVSLHITHAVHHFPDAALDSPVTLRFEVRDTGIGIAPESRGRLFQAFSQVDGSYSRRYGGTGLGLAISKELVARMDGEIGVESMPGVGTTFWFTARFDPNHALAGVRANTLPPAAGTMLHGWRVLLAGEPSADRRHVQQMFTNWGLFHQSVDDGHRALAMLRLAAASGRPFHVALLDADLSGLNGRALAAAIRSDPEVGGTRLILLSDAPPGVAVAISADLDARLPRPTRSRLLLEALRHLAAAPPRARSAPTLVAAGATDSRPHVLLAEDNPVNRQVALRQLGNLGCRTTAAHNGRELLNRVENGESFDLILMDVQMPELDGYETTRQLRAHFWSPGVGPPIVAMTANAMEGDREKCLAAGMDDYLAKPVKQDALEAVLRRWLPLRLDFADGRPRDRQVVSVG